MAERFKVANLELAEWGRDRADSVQQLKEAQQQAIRRAYQDQSRMLRAGNGHGAGAGAA